MVLLSAAIPPEERGRALGLFAGTTGLALLGDQWSAASLRRARPGTGSSGSTYPSAFSRVCPPKTVGVVAAGCRKTARRGGFELDL